MTTLELAGRITEDGQLEVQLPAGLPAGEVTVRIDVPTASDESDVEEWSEQELLALMKPKPKSGAEIAAILEQMEPIELIDPEITDPVEWVKAQRKKEAVRLKPYWEGKQ
jgi:hypothetical protein